MTTSLIVSDLHLDPADPARYGACIRAISAVPCDRLVLAGDLFEAWIGEDAATGGDLEFLKVCGGMAKDTVLIPGNRDFLLEHTELEPFGIRILTTFKSNRWAVLHGDELCTDDHAYQAFKAQVRTEQWQHEFLAKPLAERQAIAQALRRASKDSQANRPEAIGDAVPATIDAWMAAEAVTLLIHGHTHRPHIRPCAEGLLAVTSDWTDQGVGVLVHETPTQIEVTQLQLTPQQAVARQSWNLQAGTPEWKRNS